MSSVAERRQEEKDRRRAEIVDAAIELYRDAEWDTVTIDQVAKRGRLSRALVYVYFKDKEELHAAIVLRAFDLMSERFGAASERARLGLDKIEAIGRAYLAFAHELPHFFDACARFEARAALADQPDSLMAECFAAGDRVHSHVVVALQVGQRDGSIRKDLGEPKVNSMALWGFSHGLIQIARNKAEVLAHSGISERQFVDHAIAMIRSMLAN